MSLNTGLANLSSTVSQNYNALSIQVSERLKKDWRLIVNSQIPDKYSSCRNTIPDDVTDFFVVVQCTNEYSERISGFVTRTPYAEGGESETRAILLGPFSGTYDIYKCGVYVRDTTIAVTAPSPAIRVDADNYTPTSTFPIRVLIYGR